MRTTVYISKDNEELWAAIDNKSQWIADMLNGNDTDLDRRIRRIVVEEVEDAFSKRERGY